MALLEVSQVTKYSSQGVVLKNVSITQRKNEKVAIAGATGSGKSTLLKIIAGLEQPTSGSVYLQGKKISGPEDVLVPGYPEVAYLSQDFELPKFLRVEQILRYANTLTNQQAQTIYEVCKIHHLLSREANQVSGGERQRIALAKLIISSPALLLLDEPYSNLDIIHKDILKAVIEDIMEQLKISCILVSHDPLDTLSWADKVVVLKEGQILQQASPKEIYKRPVDEYVAGLFGAFNLIESDLLKSALSKSGCSLKEGWRFIRPEDIIIHVQGDGGLQGLVKRVMFYGAYCELQVELMNTILIVRTLQSAIHVGQVVGVSFSGSE